MTRTVALNVKDSDGVTRPYNAVVATDGTVKVPPEPIAPAPTPAGFPSPRCVEDFEDGVINSPWVRNVNTATFDVATIIGRRCARITAPAGSSGYGRIQVGVAWQPGADVHYGCSLFIPKLSMFPYTSLIRWDNWATYGGVSDGKAGGPGEVGGLILEAGKGKIVRSKYGGGQYAELLTGIALPEGRWFDVVIRQRFNAPNTVTSLTELFIDGAKVGSSALQNFYGRRIDHCRFGIVSHSGSSPAAELLLDRPWVT